jgi:23S rRNA pseudouridine1911/1915/1917 synthase
MIKVLYSDNHLIAVEKASGQTVQPEPGKPTSLEEEVKHHIKTESNKPGEVFLGVIHRLDMPVSGIVLFARTGKALARMNEIFRKREVRKVYHALVEGRLPQQSGLAVHYLRREESRNFTKAFVNEVKGSQEARLHYRLLKKAGKFTLVEVELLTGRKHQIRSQLSALGCPIAGDTKYGATTALPDRSIALHAALLEFRHPVTAAEIKLSSPAHFPKL